MVYRFLPAGQHTYVPQTAENMSLFSSPKNYNECLAKLNQATFITTLVFFILLRFFGLVPQVIIPGDLVPPIQGYKELIEWMLSFGVVPLTAACLGLFFSYTFELHNKVAWLIGLRPFWSRHFILRPLKKRAQSLVPLTPENAKLIMNELYYPGIKKIDEHYVHLFWRYATQFWIMIEHLTIVFVTALILSVLKWGTGAAYLWFYFILLAAIATLHLFFVAGPRSTEQALNISSQEVDEFFKTRFQDHK